MVNRIFITGITGTLGRAFTKLLKDDYELSGIDHNENGVASFVRDFPGIKVKVSDIDESELSEQDLLIHLAAMKHVDLCETNARACINNNVIKTYNLLQMAHLYELDILFMSTDKAVEPTSNYGFSKALCEGLVLEYGGAFARSGNIIASNGSVMEAWDLAIAKGEPIKLTHRDMRRYFISADNLAQRIWNKYQSGEKIIIPEMDRDLRLYDLAVEKIAAAGLPHDYPIHIIGLRPGEKLTEALTWERDD